MINEQFNNSQFNQDHNITATTKGLVEFDGFDLTSMCGGNKYGYMLQTGNDKDLDNINIGEFVSSMIDGGGVYNKKYGNKPVTFTLFIQGENYWDLIDKIDNLKKLTQGVEKDFDIYYLGGYRTTKATLSNIKFPSFGKNQDFVDNVELTFLFTTGYWENKTGVSEFLANQTDDFEVVLDNQGKYESFPKILFNCKSSGNAITKIEVEIKKVGETEGFSVHIEENITNDDLVVFDYTNKTITINGDEVNFFGPMTPLEIGQNVINVYFTGTVSTDVYIIYNKTFL